MKDLIRIQPSNKDNQQERDRYSTDPSYKQEFLFLDSKINEIEEFVILCITPLRIILELENIRKSEEDQPEENSCHF